MRLLRLSLRSLRTLVVAAALPVGAASAGAQIIGTTYAPSCGPGTSCTTMRFQILNNTASTLFINALTLSATGTTYRFAPLAGGVALYQAVDAVGPFGGTGTVSAGGAQLAINFLDPVAGVGFAFELGAGARGYVEAPQAQTTALVTYSTPFTFSATVAGRGTVTGAVTAIPEPATLALVGGGLALLGVAARRRRAASPSDVTA